MAEIPTTLEQAIAQAQGATLSAIANGYSLLQIEILIPELKPMPVAEQFLPALDSYGNQLKVFFPDAGAAALARRDWGTVPFKILDIGSGRVPIEEQVLPEDEAFLFVAPSAVEVAQVEKLHQAVGERPFILLNPRLEDVAIVGIGYAGRQLRSRFLNTVESCYYLRPIDNAAVFRCYPSPWQVWRENKNGEYQLIAEQPNKPVGDELDLILLGNSSQQTGDATQAKKPGIFASMQRFLRTLSR